jgi:hypothetical protein
MRHSNTHQQLRIAIGLSHHIRFRLVRFGLVPPLRATSQDGISLVFRGVDAIVS